MCRETLHMVCLYLF